MQISTRMMEAVNGKRNYHGGESEGGERWGKREVEREVVNMADKETELKAACSEIKSLCSQLQCLNMALLMEQMLFQPALS